MSFHKGAIVSIGSGKVHYTVLSDVVGNEAHIESQNTGKTQTIDASRLKLIQAAPVAELTDAQIEDLDDTYAESGMAAAQSVKAEYLSEFKAVPTPLNSLEDYAAWNNTYTVPSDPYAAWEIELLSPHAKYALHIDGVTTGHKSYGAACDALVIAGREGYEHAAIDHDGVRKVTR